MMISYAQNAEDVLLDRLFPRDHRGFYIDVGANDPMAASVTKHFYDLGWSGINIEPAPDVFARLRDGRGRDINLNLGLSDRCGSLPFFQVPSSPGWSTFSAELARVYRRRGMDVVEITIPVTTLARVCDDHADRPIDFLKIDVEGLEREVISGGDWSRWRPRVVVVEDAWPERWEALLVDVGYLPARRDGVNRYYVREEDRPLLVALDRPADVLYEFVTYPYKAAIDDLRSQIARDQLGLGALRIGLGVARRLNRLRARHPRLARAARRLLRDAR